MTLDERYKDVARAIQAAKTLDDLAAAKARVRPELSDLGPCTIGSLWCAVAKKERQIVEALDTELWGAS